MDAPPPLLPGAGDGGAGELPPAPPAPARITAILNCYAADGANRGQVIVHADGSARVCGEEKSLIKAAPLALRSVDLRQFNHRRR